MDYLDDEFPFFSESEYKEYKESLSNKEEKNNEESKEKSLIDEAEELEKYYESSKYDIDFGEPFIDEVDDFEEDYETLNCDIDFEEYYNSIFDTSKRSESTRNFCKNFYGKKTDEKPIKLVEIVKKNYYEGKPFAKYEEKDKPNYDANNTKKHIVDFNLDIIEEDWKKNALYLTDEEIMTIYNKEGINLKNRRKELEEFEKTLPQFPVHKEAPICYLIFPSRYPNYEKYEKEYWKECNRISNERDRMWKEECPKPKHLSIESQKMVVEGCMDVVFNNTRDYYEEFKGNVSMEKLYYLCLETLLNCAKKCVHFTTKPCFRYYVSESIRKRITSYMARLEHISYHNSYCIIKHENYYLKPDEIQEFKFDYKPKMEEPYRPCDIYELLKNKEYYPNYIEKISSDEFMQEYIQSLDKFTDQEKRIMSLLYDRFGDKLLTIKEISEKLDMDINTVKNTTDKIKRKLKNNTKFRKYR